METIFLQYFDEYTKLNIYYECKVNLDSKEVISRVLDDKPDHENIYDFDDYIRKSVLLNQINISIKQLDLALIEKWRNNDNYCDMIALYQLRKIEDNI